MPAVATLASIAATAAARLVSAGFPAETATFEAALLARHVLGWDEAQWIANRRDRAPDSGFDTALAALVARRAAREPVAYLTGTREFYGRPFAVTPDVLIPRPETELLVQEALAVLPRDRSARVLDVGTGSGCIAITIALERPDVDVVATDRSPAALEVARRNAHALGARVTFVEADLCGDARGVDVVVSNPPYVAARERETLDADVRDYEPPLALFGGEDGLDVLRRLIPAAAGALNPGGWLLLEIGAGQADLVRRLVTSSTLVWDAERRDWQDIARVVRARSKEPLA